jgi:hypothetical protein
MQVRELKYTLPLQPGNSLEQSFIGYFIDDGALIFLVRDKLSI